MKVGDKLKVELELVCVCSPHSDKGSMFLRSDDAIARVSDEGREIGDIGGGIGG